MKYRSLSLTGFEAVQVDLSDVDPIKSHRWKRTKPPWFQLMMDQGKIAPVKNLREEHVTLVNDNVTFKAFPGDYIVRNKSGLVFWMPRQLFEESFVLDNGVFATHAQQRVLDYILSCTRKPTIREIAKALGHKSTGSIHKHITTLRTKGYL